MNARGILAGVVVVLLCIGGYAWASYEVCSCYSDQSGAGCNCFTEADPWEPEEEPAP